MSKVIDNIEDIASIDSKAVLTTTQTALDLKAPLESPALTGTPTVNGNSIALIANTLSSGAIIERGSNANGEYVKFVDGTLIMHRTYTQNFTVGIQIIYVSAPTTCLSGTGVWGGNWNGSIDGFVKIGIGNNSNIGWGVGLEMSSAASSGTRFIYLSYIGRWK